MPDFRKVKSIIRQAFRANHLDYEVLGIAADWLEDEGERHKAQCIRWLIKNKKKPLCRKFRLCTEYFFFLQNNKVDYQHVLPSKFFVNELKKIVSINREINAPSFGTLIWNVMLLWEINAKI